MTSYTVTQQTINIPYVGNYTANVVTVPSRFSKTPKTYSYLPKMVLSGGGNSYCLFSSVGNHCMFPYHKAEAMCNIFPNCVGYGHTSNSGFQRTYPNLSELSFVGAVPQSNNEWYSYKL